MFYNFCAVARQNISAVRNRSRVDDLNQAKAGQVKSWSRSNTFGTRQCL